VTFTFDLFTSKSNQFIFVCGPEVLFETCVAMKFVDDDDDDLPNCTEFVNLAKFP